MLEVSLITGRLALEASDSGALVDAYASDHAVEEALAQGIADALEGIDASMVDIIDVVAGRRDRAVAARHRVINQTAASCMHQRTCWSAAARRATST